MSTYDKELFAEYGLKGIARTTWARAKEAAKAKGMTRRVWLLEAIDEKLTREIQAPEPGDGHDELS